MYHGVYCLVVSVVVFVVGGCLGQGSGTLGNILKDKILLFSDLSDLF